MSNLSTSARNALPSKSFALPGRRYPINNSAHGRNALARVSQYGTPEEKAKVRAAVHRKYPSIGAEPQAPASYKHGGVVKKTGLALVHKGETVIPKGRKKLAKNLTPSEVFKSKTPKTQEEDDEMKAKTVVKATPGAMLKKVFNPSSDKGEWMRHPSI